MDDEKREGRISAKFDSRLWKTLLLLVATFLIFAGPTYLVYLLLNILKISYVVSMISGLVLLIAGLVLIWYLVRKKIIS